MPKGSISVMAGQLDVTDAAWNWSLTIRNADPTKSMDSLGDWHEKDISPDDVRRFIGNPRTVAWKPHSEKLLKSMSGVMGVSGAYRIYIWRKDGAAPTDGDLRERLAAWLT